jgi:4-amino-4-deoxy-L-arabinose transferase-like glycosyltransferase
VTQTDKATTDTLANSPLARLASVLLILATLYICYFHNLGAIGLVGPDEPRYAWIARSMAETGDWVTPRLYGQPWFEKPVLYYWAAALNFKLFGVSEAAARLPSAIAALLATLAMAWLAWRVYGAETARWLLLLVPTTVGMIGFSHAAATDMPFAGMLTIAMVFGARLLGLVQKSFTSFTSSTSFDSCLFGFFLGLAVLAKGPAAIVLSAGSVLLWAAFTQRWNDAFRCLHPLVIASFCLTALPWYILCAHRNPDFFRIFIIEHNFKRYLTPEFQHIQPSWFYIPVVLIALVPWTLVLLWAIAIRLFHRERKFGFSPLTTFLLSWAIFCLVFFSISRSKLPGYILPAIPAIGLLLARSYVILSDQNERSLRWLLSAWAILTIPSALLLIGLGRHYRSSRTGAEPMLVAGCVLLIFALANMLLTIKSQTWGVATATAAILPVLLLVLMFQALSHPWLRWDPSGKTLAAELTAAQIAPSETYTASMKRGQQYSLSFYLHHEVRAWDPEQPKEGYLVLPVRSCNALVKPPAVCAGDPVELRHSGWFVYRVTKPDSLGGLGSLSGLSGSNSGGRSANRQPR